ncbi:MAG TPA: proline dehydrogenase family protein [Gaiella sp.]|nr:proline dehydrogenase family protein [Gaiella sp.]
MRLFDHAVARVLPVVPRGVVRRVSAPYIAGPTLEDARRVVAELNAAGMRATVDVLGEEISRPESAESIAAAYHDALAAISADGLDANVSVKLTALGLHLDPSLCRSLLAEVVRDASARKVFVRIDMEDSSTTDATLELYRSLREEGHEGVGIVFQAALRRTLSDIEALSDLRPSVRLCKGIYVEPSAIAFQERQVIRKSFVACLDALVAAGCRVAVATHDEWILEQALDRVARLEAVGYEFQMLLGVRAERGRELVAAGHPLRIYVPYGQQWYEYSLRRLQENPSVAGHVTKDVLRRLVPGR